MTYVIGDIHGRYEKYTRMLKKIGLKDKDELYVIGDMIDKGDEPVNVLLDMSMRANVFPILGDCEYKALKILTQKETDVKSSFEKWVHEGGKNTAVQFSALEDDQRAGLIEYLEELPLYEEVNINGNSYVLVHAGLANFSKERSLDDYTPEELIFEKADTEKRLLEDAVLISGHVALAEKIVRTDGHISINCGEDADSPLCAICLDTGMEYYV